MAEALIGCAAKVREKLIATPGRQLGYVLYYKNYIEILKQQVEKLIVTSNGITIEVEDAKRNGEVIAPETDQWIRNVELVSDDSIKFLNDEVQERNSLWNGWFLNVRKRYMLCKKAKKKTKQIAALKTEVPNKISYQAPPPAVGDISSGYFKNIEPRIHTINRLMNLLKDDTKKIISICGMGGSGKTTMVKEVARHVEAEKLFDEIIMAVVSKEHDLMRVQEDLAIWLGLRFKTTTQEGRAHELWKRLLQSKKGNLVILDDVWKKIDLKSIGIPFGKEYNNCKVILTSRSKDACKAMGCHDILTLDTLTESETWSLLGEMVGDSLQSDPELSQTASEIAKRCGGLPIAVVCLGRALKDKRKEVWNDTLKKLQISMVPENIEGVKEDVYQSLKLSYDLLEDLEAKKVFLLCCLYPEYANVPLEALVRCGMGLDLYRGIEFLIDARDRVHALTEKLKSRYLLLSGDRKSTVKVHSVVRAVGISVASMLEQNLGQFSAAVIHEDRWPRGMTYGNYNAVSVVSNEISELPSRGLIFHKLELLQLACPKLSLENINIMFERMKTVKVVELWNMSLFSLSSFLNSLPRDILALCMNCKMENIGDVKAEEFKNLEILSFGNCDIMELPEQIGRFTNLRLLDMSSCRRLERISPGVISSLSQLEELDTGSKLWGDEEEGDASLSELDSLNNLIYLGIRIKSISFLPRNSLFEKLQRYVIYVGVHLEKSRSFNNKMLLLKLDITDTHIGGGIDKILRDTEKVFLTGDGMENALKELIPGGFQLVKTLSVENCNNEGVEYLSDRSYSSNASGVFSSLEKLRMEKMGHLKGILRHDDQGLPVTSFSRLRNIHLSVLPEMAHLFNLSVAMNLVHLESLHIEYCTIMQQVIDNPSPSEPSTTENKLIFPKLTKLVLNDIISLVCFTQGINLQVDFPLLKVLKLKYLQNFHTFCPEEINLASKVNYKGINFQSLVDHKVEFSSLAELTVTKVDNIKEVWCGHIPNQNLQGLYIQFCLMMEEVISIQRPSVTTNEEKIVFPKLKEVILFGLNRLTFFCRGIDHVDFPQLRLLRLRWLTHFKTFCSEETAEHPSSVFNNTVMLPSLETLEVSELDSVEELWSSQLPASHFRRLKYLRVEKCHKLVNIFSSDLQTLFPSLEKLEVEKCDSLEEVWASKAAPIRNLKSILVYECPKLRNLCSSYTFKGLLHLMTIDIYSCKMMEVVVADDQKDVEINEVLSLDKLEEVKLEFLPNLNYFSDTECDLELPELIQVIVKNCPDMCTFTESSVKTPKLKFAVLDDVNTWLGDLNETVQQLLGKVMLHRPDTLEVSKLDSIEQLWSRQLPTSHFHELKSLRVEKCHKLVNIFPSDLQTLFPSLEKLEVEKCDSLEEVWASKAAPIRNLKSILVYECPKLRNLCSSYTFKGLLHLMTIDIYSCKMMEVVVADDQKDVEINGVLSLDKLEKVKLDFLPNLKYFSDTKCDLELPELTQVIVKNCPDMRTFTESSVKTPKLKFAVVDNLQSWLDDLNDTVQHLLCQVTLPSPDTLEISELDSAEQLWSRQLPTSHFHELKSLRVEKCHKLVNIFPWDLQTQIPSLEKLEVEKCDSLEEVWASKAAAVRSLKSVHVNECSKLRNLCSSYTFKGLSNLMTIDISSCKMMEAVVADDHKDVKINGVLSLNKLEEVKLEFLPNLNYFSDTKCDLELPELTQVIVKNCPDMRTFTEGSVRTPKLKFAVLDDVNTWLGHLNKTVQHWFSTWEY